MKQCFASSDPPAAKTAFPKEKREKKKAALKCAIGVRSAISPEGWRAIMRAQLPGHDNFACLFIPFRIGMPLNLFAFPGFYYGEILLIY
jgi:hypothetical protein